jgi:hypothetical protein
MLFLFVLPVFRRNMLMMQQSKTMSHPARPLVRPKRLDIFFHGIKTFKLVGALLTDRRVPLMRKALFLGSVGALLVILIFPDALGEFVLSTVLPLVGTVLGVPLDAGFDWVAFALLIVNLLRFFPAEVVAEHYRNIFG